MEMNPKMKLMLAFAVLLAAIKFALLPLLAWQNDLIEQTMQLERRNDKSERLINDQAQLIMQLATMSRDYKARAEAFPSYQDKTSFRLETQIMFEQILLQDELRTKRFFWRESEDTQVFGNLYKASFNVSFTGMAKGFALLQSKLLNNYPQYKIPNMSINISNQNDKSIGIVDGSVTVEAFYWLGGGQ